MTFVNIIERTALITFILFMGRVVVPIPAVNESYVMLGALSSAFVYIGCGVSQGKA